jgi:hypothetical protein
MPGNPINSGLVRDKIHFGRSRLQGIRTVIQSDAAEQEQSIWCRSETTPPLVCGFIMRADAREQVSKISVGVEADIPSELVNKRESIDLERLFADL